MFILSSMGKWAITNLKDVKKHKSFVPCLNSAANQSFMMELYKSPSPSSLVNNAPTSTELD